MPHEQTAPSGASEVDIIHQLAQLQPQSPVAELRARRPDVVQQTQNSYNTLFAPSDPDGFTLPERAQAALRVAILAHSPALTNHYRQLLLNLGAAETLIAAVEQFPNGGALSSRSAAILRHVDLLTQSPAAATPTHLAALQSEGLSVRNIVTLSQLIAFLSFQVRTVVGLQLLQGDH